jgi:chromosome segregation ATPase
LPTTYSILRINFCFRCLDEWDVYLDEAARTKIEEMLMEFAVASDSQYIFISPQTPTFTSSKVNTLTLQ